MPYNAPLLLVSHLAQSTSFYLTALQPLGYSYIDQDGDAVGFGKTNVKLYIRQKSSRQVPINLSTIGYLQDLKLI